MTTSRGEATEEVPAAVGRGPLLVAAAAGALVGLLGRDLPVVVVLLSGVGTSEAQSSCGMEEAAACAFEQLPDALGALLTFALVVVVVAGVLAAAGAVLVFVGLARRRRRDSRVWLPLAMVAFGTALVMPALALLFSFIAAVAS